MCNSLWRDSICTCCHHCYFFSLRLMRSALHALPLLLLLQQQAVQSNRPGVVSRPAAGRGSPATTRRTSSIGVEKSESSRNVCSRRKDSVSDRCITRTMHSIDMEVMDWRALRIYSAINLQPGYWRVFEHRVLASSASLSMMVSSPYTCLYRMQNTAFDPRYSALRHWDSPSLTSFSSWVGISWIDASFNIVDMACIYNY